MHTVKTGQRCQCLGVGGVLNCLCSVFSDAWGLLSCDWHLSWPEPHFIHSVQVQDLAWKLLYHSREPFWNLLLPLVPPPSTVGSPQAHSPIKSKQLSGSHGFWLWRTPELTISHWLRHHMSTFPPLLCATPTPHWDMWTLLFLAITRWDHQEYISKSNY